MAGQHSVVSSSPYSRRTTAPPARDGQQSGATPSAAANQLKQVTMPWRRSPWLHNEPNRFVDNHDPRGYTGGASAQGPAFFRDRVRRTAHNWATSSFVPLGPPCAGA